MRWYFPVLAGFVLLSGCSSPKQTSDVQATPETGGSVAVVAVKPELQTGRYTIGEMPDVIGLDARREIPELGFVDSRIAPAEYANGHHLFVRGGEYLMILEIGYLARDSILVSGDTSGVRLGVACCAPNSVLLIGDMPPCQLIRAWGVQPASEQGAFPYYEELDAVTQAELQDLCTKG